MVEKVVMKMGKTVQVQGVLYNSVFQAVLIFRREIWVVTVSMLKLLEVFLNRAARRIFGKTNWHTMGG